MKYIELSEDRQTITFSQDAVKAMKLKEGSALLVFGIEGQLAFGFQERKQYDFSKMKLCYLQKPKQFSKRLITVCEQPTPGFMMWMMHIDTPTARMELKERVNNEGQIIHYIGQWREN